MKQPALLTPEDVQDILKRNGILLTGDHFVLKSGRHASDFVTKPSAIEGVDLPILCNETARRIKPCDVQVVVGPATGGIRLSQLIAAKLAELYGHEVIAVTAKKREDGKGFYFEEEDLEKLRGKRCVVCEDTMTTGGSAKTVVDLIREVGGRPIGVTAIVNRGKVVTKDVGTEWFLALCELDLPSWTEEEMPDWLRDRPINEDHGHGAEYMRKKRDAEEQPLLEGFPTN